MDLKLVPLMLTEFVTDLNMITKTKSAMAVSFMTLTGVAGIFVSETDQRQYRTDIIEKNVKINDVSFNKFMDLKANGAGMISKNTAGQQAKLDKLYKDIKDKVNAGKKAGRLEVPVNKRLMYFYVLDELNTGSGGTIENFDSSDPMLLDNVIN